MENAASPIKPSPTSIFRRVYRRSWFDQFTDWVDRLPGPAWLFYVGLWGVLILLEMISQITDAGLALPTPFHLVFTASVPFGIAILHYTDKVAEGALTKFRPVMDCSDEEYAAAQYRISNMPYGLTIVSMVVGIVLGASVLFVMPLEFRLTIYQLARTDLSANFNGLLTLIAFVIAFVVFYHVRHQFETIISLLKLYTDVDLYNLGPLYAFSNVSALTAISLLVVAYAWVSTVPSLLEQPIIIPYFILFVIAAGLVFILPLWQLHQLLVGEKERMLTEVGAQMETLSHELYRRLDGGQITDMDNLNKALASLEIEYATLKRVPTWPWQPETLRAVIIAVLFPVIVWLIQWSIERALAA